MDEIWKLGYIEMKNPVVAPLRDHPFFNSFVCHLTPPGIEHIQEIKSKTIEVEGKEIDLEQLLINNESTNLEIKGSCQLDINRLLKGDDKKKLLNQNAKDGVLKSIVAFLNTSGGDVILGALEKAKFTEEEINKIPSTVYENYYLIGVNIENDNIDNYELTIRDLIANHISKSVISLLDISFPKINGNTLCRITVNQASDKWYYMDEEVFYMRDGNRTISLKGNDADEYRKRNPR